MAGVQWQTSFDHYTTVTHRFNSIVAVTPTIGAYGRNGTNGLRWASGAANPSVAVKATLPSTLSTIFFAFAFRVSALPTAGFYMNFARISDAGSIQCELHLRSDGTIQVFRGDNAALLGTLSGFAVLPNVYYHVEWKTVIDSSSGVVQVWINEVSRLSLSSQNTKGAGSSVASEIQLAAGAQTGSSNNGTTDFDDVIVRDDQQIGDRQVLALLPTGTGGTDNWSKSGAATSHACTNESPPDEDLTRIESSTPGDKTILTYPNIPTTSSIDAIVPLPRLEKTDAGTATARSFWHSGSGDSAGATKAPSNSAYEYHPDVWMVNPDTSSPFTPSEWNTAGNGVGIERVS